MKVFRNVIITIVVCMLVLGFVQICVADNYNIVVEESGDGAKLVLTYKSKKYEVVLSPYSGNTTTEGSITLEQAKTIALNDAGLTDADFKKAKMDYDDGRTVYEIEFVYDNKEYDYEIDSSTGRILDTDIEYKNKNSGNKNSSSDTAYNITAAEAESIALKSGGVSRSDVKYIHSYIDNDDGRTVYEVEFLVNNTEYEYKIDVNSGAILEQDIETHR